MRYTGKWRIFYGDGSTYSDRDGSPYDAPGDNVQVICVERDNSTAPPLAEHNLYRWNGESWTGCNWTDLGQYFIRHDGPQKVLLGYEMNQRADYLAILERAIKEGVG